MSFVVIFICVLIFTIIAAAGGAFAMHVYLTRASRDVAARFDAKRAALADTLARERELMRTSAEEMSAELARTADQLAETSSQLHHQEKENEWLTAELASRPFITRKVYRLQAVGMRSTGKTSLTLKWASPIINLEELQATTIEHYERTVSRVVEKEVATEHVFEIRDWGGEFIVDALGELIREEIHGLLIVVDLGGKDATGVEQARVDEQLRQFNPQVLQFYFGHAVVSSCKTVVLFINKSDLLSGTPTEVEAQARQIYSPLINNLMKYSMHVDIRVLVGSSNYGHSTHHLFAHFVERILPRSAYDMELLRGVEADVILQEPVNDSHGDDTAQAPPSDAERQDEAANAAPSRTDVLPGGHASGATGTNGAQSGYDGSTTARRLRVVR